MTDNTHGQVPAIQRYKIGYHSDEWGVRSLSPTGIYDDAGPWVRYEDHAAALHRLHAENEALRTQQPAPATQQAEVRPVTPYTCPKCHALWLHWPAEQTGFGRDTLNCRSADHCHYCEKAGVEQLQRLERIPAALHAPQPSPTAQAADSVTAPAGPSKSLPYEPTSAMLIAARERDPALPIETVRAIYWSMWRTAPTPPAQAADSVLEDAARLDWLALAGPVSICVVIDRPHDGEVEVATDDVTGYGKTLREALDAARKQGGQHGTE